MISNHSPDRPLVAYYRVSTAAQGLSGLGLEAQRSSVAAFLSARSGRLIAEFEEVETGKGSNALERRPQLRAAMEACRKHKATLLIAKLDRLARNVHFVSGLIESHVEFVAADMPEASKAMIQIHCVMSEWERDQISKRTKEALAAAKARGIRLGVAGPRNLKSRNNERHEEAIGFADRLREHFEAFERRRLTQRQIVGELNERGITARNGGRWTLVQVQRVLKRLAAPAPIRTTGPEVGTW